MISELPFKIKRLRELKSYKQETVAAYLGITQSAYSRLENGECKISMEHITKLSDLFEMDPEQLIAWNGQIHINTVNGVGINQATANVYTNSEKINELEKQVKDLVKKINDLKQK